MAYLIVMTAAGHRLAVSPRKQRLMFRDIQDALMAEARVGKRCVSYNGYRTRRGAFGDCLFPISISFFARKQLDKMEDDTFRRIDQGIGQLLKRPNAKSTKPKYYRWFLGDLRRVLVDEFPVLYSFDDARE